MGAAYKHSGHRFNGSAFVAAAGTAVVAPILIYDAYPDNPSGTVANATSGSSYDTATEQVVEASCVLGASLTGQATNYTGFGLVQYRAGAVKNRIVVQFLTTAVINVALNPINLAVASGAVVPGTVAGTLTVTTGVGLPWTLAPGDVVLGETIVTGNGQYADALGFTIKIAPLGA